MLISYRAAILIIMQVFVINFYVISQEVKMCWVSSDEVNECLQSLAIFGNRNFTPPQTIEEVDTFCDQSEEAFQCLQNYSEQCLQPEMREYFEVAIHGIPTTIKHHCSTLERRRDLIAAMACPVWSQTRIMDRIHSFVDLAVAQLDWIKDSEPDQLPDSGDRTPPRVTASCCAIKSLQHRITQIMLKHGCDQPGRRFDRFGRPRTSPFTELVSFLTDDMVGSSSFLDLLCPSIKYFEDCERDHPELVAIFNDLEKDFYTTRQDQTHFRSLLLPVIESLTLSYNQYKINTKS